LEYCYQLTQKTFLLKKNDTAEIIGSPLVTTAEIDEGLDNNILTSIHDIILV
jgi:hypothetical protein